MKPWRNIALLSSLLVGSLTPSLVFGQNTPSSQPASAPTSTPQNNPFPYGNSQFPHGNSNTNANPYGNSNSTNSNPYSGNSNPYGGNTNPYGNAKPSGSANPYGNTNSTGANPYGNATSSAGATPYTNNNAKPGNAAPSNTANNPALTPDTADRPPVAHKVLYGGAGLFGVGGLVTAGLALNFKSKAKDTTTLLPGEALTVAQSTQAQQLIQSTRTMALISDVSLGLSLGCLAGGFLVAKNAKAQASISPDGASVSLVISH